MIQNDFVRNIDRCVLRWREWRNESRILDVEITYCDNMARTNIKASSKHTRLGSENEITQSAGQVA